MSSGTGRACRAGMTASSAQLPPCGVDHDHALALDETAEQARPDLIHDSDPLEARRRRQSREDAIPTLDDQQVGRVDRAENHPHPDLARPRLGVRDLADAEHLGRLAKGFKNGGFHAVILMGSRRSPIDLPRSEPAARGERTLGLGSGPYLRSRRPTDILR